MGSLVQYNAKKIWSRDIASSAPSNGDVLTWNASGSIWQPSSGVNSFYDATVGTSGADYTTLKGAIDASKVRILVIDDTTEAADIAVPAGGFLVYIIAGATVTMGGYQFTYAQAADVTIEGQGEIDYTHTGANELLFQNSSYTTSKVIFNGITVDNNSSQDGCHLADGVQIVDSIRWELSNNNNGGIESCKSGSRISNVEFVGGGSSCENACKTGETNNVVWNNILFTGTFGNGSAIHVEEEGVLNNVVFNHDTNDVTLNINTSGQVSNVNVVGSQALNVAFTGSSGSLTNAFLNAGKVDPSGADYCKVVNVQTTGALDLSDTGSTNCLIENCKFDTALSCAGDRHKFVNCDFIGGVTVTADSNDCGFHNCQAGVDAGGGALTITITAGSNRTRLIGCMTDAAISDAGTGSVLLGNTVY